MICSKVILKWCFFRFRLCLLYLLSLTALNVRWTAVNVQIDALTKRNIKTHLATAVKSKCVWMRQNALVTRVTRIGHSVSYFLCFFFFFFVLWIIIHFNSSLWSIIRSHISRQKPIFKSFVIVRRLKFFLFLFVIFFGHTICFRLISKPKKTVTLFCVSSDSEKKRISRLISFRCFCRQHSSFHFVPFRVLSCHLSWVQYIAHSCTPLV